MNSRLIYTLANNIDDIKESSFIDCYNNIIREGIAGAIKTTIDTANMSYVIVKDNRDMNEEIKTEVVGTLNEGKWAKMHEQSRRVYGTDGIAPTIHTCGGGNLEPKIMEEEKQVLGWTRDKNGKVTDRHPVDVANCITSNKGSNTQNYVRETITYRGKEFKEGDGLYLFDSEKFASGGLEGISRTLKAEKADAAVVSGKRIRKLTERECFRLMGCDDADIDKIQSAGISKTQQYKMAGNSIVVDVLYHIFRKMFVETKPEGGTQLELF